MGTLGLCVSLRNIRMHTSVGTCVALLSSVGGLRWRSFRRGIGVGRLRYSALARFRRAVGTLSQELETRRQQRISHCDPAVQKRERVNHRSDLFPFMRRE